MTLPSYRVPDLPTRGAEAFLPTPPPTATVSGLSSWGLVHVTGSPGSTLLPSPEPPPANYLAISGQPQTQGGKVSPDEVARAPLGVPQGTWKPAVYVALPDNMGPQAGALGIRVRHHEDIPVPATMIQPVAIPVQRTPPMTYGRVTPNPRVFPNFPTVLQSPR